MGRLQEREEEIQDVRDLLERKGYELNKEGVIAYKTFGSVYSPRDDWRIRKGSIINEPICDYNVDDDCGFGINVSTLEWVERTYGTRFNQDNYNWEYKSIWKCLIKNEWLHAVCVPRVGLKIRCERVLLLECLKKDHSKRKTIRKKLGIGEYNR